MEICSLIRRKRISGEAGEFDGKHSQRPARSTQHRFVQNNIPREPFDEVTKSIRRGLRSMEHPPHDRTEAAPDDARRDVSRIAPQTSSVEQTPVPADPSLSTRSLEVDALGWTRDDRLVAGGLLTLAALAAVVRFSIGLGSSRLPEPLVVQNGAKYVYQIDVNQADWLEWMQVEGVGEILARRIVADRESNGPFRSIDDLVRVKGVGRKLLDSFRHQLRDPSASASPEAAP